MDRLLRYIRDIRQATFFDIQNVSDYFWINKNEYSDLTDMNLAPPFDFFATRYTIPDRIYSDEKGWTDAAYAGMEILTVFRALERQFPGIDMKWFYDIMLFGAEGKKIYPTARWTAAVDDLGRIAKQPDGETAFWITVVEGTEPPHQAMISYLHVSGLALTFLNCRNVEILPAYPDRGKQRQARKRQWESRYHRLKVNAIGQRRETTAGGSTGIKQGLSITRGHFREYGPAYGKGKLFGRLEGRFWVAAFIKGDPETGIIAKDYTITKKENSNDRKN